MRKINELHDLLTELENDECKLLDNYSAIQYKKKERIIDLTSNTNWRKLKITNSEGRKAYIEQETLHYDAQLNSIKSDIRWNKCRQKKYHREYEYIKEKGECDCKSIETIGDVINATITD